MVKAVLLQGKYQLTTDLEYYSTETKNLASALNIQIEEVFYQSMDKMNTKSYFNKGKVQEVVSWVKQYNENVKDEGVKEEIQLIIVGEEISALISKNLNELFKLKIYDRTDIILEIFNERAKSKEAKLQIKIAKLEYNLGKIIGSYSNLAKQRGSSGGGISRGSGETQLELDRRKIKDEIASAKKELKKFSAHRKSQRQKRQKDSLPIISVVGYTNVGKSTFMNSFVQEDKKVLQKDQLFATLDTTVRKINLSTKKEVLLVDTVGFVSNLPHKLIKAFSSTLEEVVYSDLIIHLKDLSTPYKDLHDQIIKETLLEIGAQNIETLDVYNKIDLVEEKQILEENKNEVLISAKEKQGYDYLIKEIEKRIYKNFKKVKLKLDYTQMKDYNYIKNTYDIIKEQTLDDGIEVEVYLDQSSISKYNKQIID